MGMMVVWSVLVTMKDDTYREMAEGQLALPSSASAYPLPTPAC